MPTNPTPPSSPGESHEASKPGAAMSAKEKVLAVYPDAQSSYINCGMGSSYWIIFAIGSGGAELGRAYCGAMSDERAWADAARRIMEASSTESRQGLDATKT